MSTAAAAATAIATLLQRRQVSNRCFSYMRDPVLTYIRIIEDLQRIAATKPQPLERSDPQLLWEIKEAKEELASKHGYVYLDGHDGPFRLVPEIKKCYHCGKIITTTDLCCL